MPLHLADGPNIDALTAKVLERFRDNCRVYKELAPGSRRFKQTVDGKGSIQTSFPSRHHVYQTKPVINLVDEATNYCVVFLVSNQKERNL